MIDFEGDSITEEWDLSGISGAVNYGVGGETPDGLSERWSTVLARRPWCVHILIGTNAVANTTQMLASAATILSLAQQARAKGIKVVMCKIPPRDWDIGVFNNKMAENAATYRFQLADHFTPLDLCLVPNQYLFKGIPPYVRRPFPAAGQCNPHPNRAGHEAMTDAANQAIKALRARAATISRETLWLSQ